MQFSDVVGQEAVKQSLRQRLAEGRVPHAMMFSGPSGAGGFPLALAFVQYMACRQRTETDSCGVCPTCRKIAKLAHPDLHFCMPLLRNRETDDPNQVDADMLDRLREQMAESAYFSEADWYERLGDSGRQGIISAAASRRALNQLLLKSFELPYKFLVVWLPERMHVSAANRLLKIIEEPPEGTYFLFVSARPHELLATIRSRVQQTLLPPLRAEDIAVALESRGLATGSRAEEIAHAAQGSYTDAVELAGQEGEPPQLALLRDLYRNAITHRYQALMQWVEQVAKLGREPQKALLTYFARMAREMYMFNLGQEALCFSIGPERTFARKVSPYIHGWNIAWLLDEYSTARFQISRNGNPSIVFTDLAIRHVRMIQRQIRA